MIGMPSRIGSASLAAREISSCLALSYSSVPLVSGQTRISSSFGSTLLAGRSVVIACSGVSADDSTALPLLQLGLAFALALGKLDLGQRHQDLGAEIGRGHVRNPVTP